MNVSSSSSPGISWTSIHAAQPAPEENDVWSSYQDVFQLRDPEEARTADQFAQAEQRLRQRQREMDQQRLEAEKQSSTAQE